MATTNRSSGSASRYDNRLFKARVVLLCSPHGNHNTTLASRDDTAWLLAEFIREYAPFDCEIQLWREEP